VALLLAACAGSGMPTPPKVPSPTAARPADPAGTAATRPRAAAGARTTPGAVPVHPSAACATSSHVAVGEQVVDVTSGGVKGTYIRHVPPGYDGRNPLPVVFDLHGYDEPAAIELRMSELAAYGDTHGFLTVLPETVAKVPLWNVTLGSGDLAFLGGVLDEVERTLCVDTSRVFAAGLSNGAFMASAVACQYGDRIAAVAAVAGIQDIQGCAPSRPVPVVAFHGTADPFVAFDGGFGPAVASLPTPDGTSSLGASGALPKAVGPSITGQAAAWARRNGCGSTPGEEAVAGDVTVLRFPCPAGAEVELYRITGGGHAWPGSALSRSIAAITGPTTFSISADRIVWDFFSAHPLPARA